MRAPASAVLGPAGIIGVFMMGATLPSPLYVVFAERVGFGAVEITLLYAAYVFPALFGLVVLGSLSDGLGRLPVIALALVLAILSTICFVTAESIVLLYAGRVFMGLGVGLAMSAATAMVSDLRPEPGRGASGVAAVATMLGLAVGPIVGGVLSEVADDPVDAVFFAYLGLVVVVLAWTLTVARETVARRGRSIRLQLRVRRPPDATGQFTVACLASFAGLALQGFLGALAGLFLAETLGEPNRVLSGLTLGAVFVLAAVPPRFLPAISNRAAMLWTAGLIAASVALIELAVIFESLPAFVLAAIFSGLASGCAFAAGLAVTNALVREGVRGEVFSAFYVASYAGLILPVIGVGIATIYVSLELATSIFALWLALVTAWLWVVALRGREPAVAG